MDGIYIAYFSGWLGNSFGVFHLSSGAIKGFDAGGVFYGGQYHLDLQGHCLGGTLYPRFDALSSTHPVPQELLNSELKLPPYFIDGQLHQILAPVGYISVSFERLVQI
jgi:hypothetical protein